MEYKDLYQNRKSNTKLANTEGSIDSIITDIKVTLQKMVQINLSATDGHKLLMKAVEKAQYIKKCVLSMHQCKNLIENS